VATGDDMLNALPNLPRDDAGPVFKAPWEAQVFAMALALHEGGAFSWKEWTQTLAAVIGETKARGDADTGEDYYRHWLTALERITAKKGLITDDALQARREQWAQAAHATPHGRPIELHR
jgi:nitrile hydratase accessory protein